jgi:chromosome segregation ATPase
MKKLLIILLMLSIWATPVLADNRDKAVELNKQLDALTAQLEIRNIELQNINLKFELAGMKIADLQAAQEQLKLAGMKIADLQAAQEQLKKAFVEIDKSIKSIQADIAKVQAEIQKVTTIQPEEPKE